MKYRNILFDLDGTLKNSAPGIVESFSFAFKKTYGIECIENIKSLIGACLGLLMSMIGVAVIGGDMRMTWNISFLNSGIEIVSAMIGLFCIPVILDLTSMKGKHLSENTTPKSLRLKESFLIMYRKKFEALRGAFIGTFIGILPGAGGSIASIVSYGEAKRSSKNKDNFGKGEPEGLIASETANNATVGGGFENTASGLGSTVGGGFTNTASGNYGTVTRDESRNDPPMPWRWRKRACTTQGSPRLR